MKDNRLEKEFEEYFKGVNTPDDITADAKKYVKPKNKFLPKFAKYASIAASFILVFAVSLTLILRADFSKKDGAESGDSTPSASAPDISDNDNSSSEPENPSNNEASSGGTAFRFYTDAELEAKEVDAYALSSLNSSLKFIQNFAYADNASVDRCTASYKENALTLVKADVNLFNGLNRDETQIYVEFTEDKLVYEDLSTYYDGRVYKYKDAEYYLTQRTAANGEPEFMLHINYNGVKYYFNVRSSDYAAYRKYLALIVK